MDNVTFEICSEVIISMSQIVPDFGIVFRFDDLYAKPADMDLAKRIAHQATLYFVMKEWSA